jgi:hypothetical protein
MCLKYFEKIQKWVPPHHNKEKSSYQYMSAKVFRGAAQQHVNVSPLDFCLFGHLKPLVCSAAIENEDTLLLGFLSCLFNQYSPPPPAHLKVWRGL